MRGRADALELRYDVGEGEVAYETVAAGGSLTVDTFHGHAWRAYDAAGEFVSSFVIDAREGARQEFRPGGDELR